MRVQISITEQYAVIEQLSKWIQIDPFFSLLKLGSSFLTIEVGCYKRTDKYREKSGIISVILDYSCR